MTAEERRRRSIEEGRRLIEAWRASGLSQRAFAATHGVQPQRLSYWRLRLEGHPQEAEAIPPVAASAFVQVAAPSARADGMTIEWPDGVRLHVGAGIDAGVLRTVVLALRGRSAGAC